jgi:hypothetical protein
MSSSEAMEEAVPLNLGVTRLEKSEHLKDA